MRPAFYLSAYLEAHRTDYYSRLASISTDGDYQGWVSFFLEAVCEQADLDALFGFPLFSSPRFVRESGIPSASAARLLKQLREAGVLGVVRAGRGRRPTIWKFPELLETVR